MTARHRLKLPLTRPAAVGADLATGLLLAGKATLFAAAPAADQHWPQWRGPLANGVSPTASPPLTWSETENVKWKTTLPGRGTASPIIWGNQIFLLSAVPTGRKAETGTAEAPADPPAGGPPGGRRRSEKPTEAYQFVLLCVDRDSGKLLWQKVAREEVPHEGHHPDHGFASYSPVTDGQLVFASFGSRGLYAFDLAGNLKWQKDLGDMQTRNSFGEGSSPALFGNTLIVNWDHEGEDFVAAFDKTTGNELWRQARDEETSWATPLVVEHDGKPQVITSATRKVRSYDLATGKLLWECGGMTANVIPTPVAGHGMVYPISGFRGAALLAVRLDRTGDLTDSDAIAWRHAKGTPYVPSPLLYDDHLYFFSGNNGILSAFDARTGRALFEAERLEALSGVYASPVGASGRVYLVGRNGVTVVIRNSHQLEVLATNRLEDRFDASPALAGKDLLLRGREHLYCLAGN
ncbi:MAG: PQQ-binding-like beta-propeller repeat protein [Bryobacteraceae bacterium]|nr:PQQ-binding-like beta-propeller repeat protein [Bryobacteraceae bacterium]